MIATTIEQSRHLLELGLDPKTADMYYLPQVMNEGETLWPIDEGYDLDDADQPAWSLSALLEVMKEHCPELLFLEAYWYCRCMQVESEYCDEPITAVYDVLCWLLERGLVEKGGNNENPHRHP